MPRHIQVVNPVTQRESPYHDQVYQKIADLQAPFQRYVPWLPYPRLGVAELEPPSNGTMCGFVNSGGAGNIWSTTLDCGAQSAGVIESVVFENYGQPTGYCNHLKASPTCSKDVTAVVAAACVGKAACTLLSSDATFGAAPCAASRLAVEVTCSNKAVTTFTYWDFKFLGGWGARWDVRRPWRHASARAAPTNQPSRASVHSRATPPPPPLRRGHDGFPACGECERPHRDPELFDHPAVDVGRQRRPLVLPRRSSRFVWITCAAVTPRFVMPPPTATTTWSLSLSHSPPRGGMGLRAGDCACGSDGARRRRLLRAPARACEAPRAWLAATQPPRRASRRDLRLHAWRVVSNFNRRSLPARSTLSRAASSMRRDARILASISPSRTGR